MGRRKKHQLKKCPLREGKDSSEVIVEGMSRFRSWGKGKGVCGGGKRGQGNGTIARKKKASGNFQNLSRIEK